MRASIVLHEDAYYEYFKPVHQPLAQYDIWGGYGLETFGNDLKIARFHNQAFVWTVVDSPYGSDMLIIPEMHFVNRVCYLITENPHNWIDVEFRVRSYSHSLTELGLKRQLSKLKSLLGNQGQHAMNRLA